jgi:hypothetical protein
LAASAKDDPPEVRERLFKWIRDTDCSLEMVVGRKIHALFARKHNGKDSEFYADLLSHLLKTKHYDFVRERISLVVDLYDAENYDGSRNYYTPKRPLIAENKLGPPVS